MEYRCLGRSGLEVSAVGLGTNNFGARIDYQQTDRVIHQAVDIGVNLIDTSNTYGKTLSEEYIGKSTKGIRGQVLLATKAAGPVGQGPNQAGTSRKHLMEQVDLSLQRLQTDHIDLYQMHYPNSGTPIEETLRTLDDLVRQGKVRYIGCSNYAAWQLAEAVLTSHSMHWEAFISVQPPYNMLDREIEKELIPCCEAYGIGILPYYPLASGFLTGKYRRGESAQEGTRLYDFAKAQSNLTDRNFDLVDRLTVFASERGHSTQELAIAWLLANPSVGSVIAGARLPEQVVANVNAADWQLTPEDLHEIDGILNGGE
jgi:aryl-alcohol dehydrogenase-like predicted oxidoreductase